MAEQEDFDENDTSGLEDSENMFAVPGGQDKTPKSVASSDAPVSNAYDIPLFLDADKRSTRTGGMLEIIKIDKPNSGFKGRISLSSTLETISKLFGNGIYNINLLNQRGQILRTKESVEISVPDDKGPIDNNPLRSNSPPNSENILTLIKSAHLSHHESQKIQVALAKEAGDRSIELAKSHTESIIATSSAAIERDRTYMEGMLSREREFMANMQLSQDKQHERTLAFMSAQHQMTLQILLSQNENKRDPIELLVQGISLAQSLGGNSEDDPAWIKGLDKGASMIQNLAGLAMLNAKNKEASASNPAKAPNTKKSINDKKPKITKPEAQALLNLKETLRKRGIDFEEMLRHADKQYSEATPTPDDSGEDEEADDESSSIENDSSTPME